MFCIKCGKTLEPTARVCPDCGTKVVLPEGFVPEPEKEISIDVDLLTGEKTVAADHEALARKAAAASAQTAEPIAPTPVFTAPAANPTSESPKLSTGFDLNSAKKIMNGRSILIDDSPAEMPAFVAAPVSAPSNNGNANKPDSKKFIIIIVAAIAVIAVAIGAVLFVLLNKDNDGENNENSPEETTENVNVEETLPEIIDTTKEYLTQPFEENTTLGDIAQDLPTDPESKPNRPQRPSKPEKDDKDDKVSKEETEEAKTEATTMPAENPGELETVPTEPSSQVIMPNENLFPIIPSDSPESFNP